MFEKARNRGDLIPQAVWLAVWVVVTLVGGLLAADPSGHGTHRQLGLPACTSAMLLGRPCPGCGMTTSWTALLHGEWVKAFAAHPLGPPSYLFFTLSALMALVGCLRGLRVRAESRAVNLIVGGYATFFLLFGLYRMATRTDFAAWDERAVRVESLDR